MDGKSGHDQLDVADELATALAEMIETERIVGGEFIILGNRLVIRPHQRQLSSIIETPEMVQAPGSESGEIIAMGAQVDRSRHWLGQVVAFTPRSGDRLKVGSEEYLILSPLEMRLEVIDNGAA